MSVAAWRTLLRERAPLPVLLAVGAAQAASATVVVGAPLRTLPLAMGAATIAAQLVMLRLMDEVKDIAKDRVAYPARPLPRGLVTVEGTHRAVVNLARALCAVGVVLAFAIGTAPAAWCLATIGWSWLMYREFYAPRLLARNAFVYALTHQAVLLPMYLFTMRLALPLGVLPAATLWFVLGGVGAGFAFEIARKLDPAAPAILRTYLARHRAGPTFSALALALGLAAWAAHSLGVAAIVWPFVVASLAAAALTIAHPARHQLVARTVGVLVVIQLLAPALRRAGEIIIP